ncbi:MAG: metallophosphoesterase [Thaumarchaeota archaeon]|nr:metallophosphoesterase [Nitrososphaerota archaeon]
MSSENGKVLVATDQHLGYANSDVASFENFLDYVSKRSDVGTLAILGDLVDLWRRDVSGLFLEQRESMDKLVELSSSIKVCFVVGNHDFHLRELEDHGYPFKFPESMAPIQVGSTTYDFKHGWEFDLEQQPPIMEALCHNLSDEAGADRTKVYSAFTGLEDKLEDVFKLHGGMDGYIDHLLQGPESRLENILPTIEKAAYASLKPGERLIFGHTHRPFVSADGRLANAGSWVTDAPVHNTFVELDEDQARLFVFDVAGITEIIERKPLSELT